MYMVASAKSDKSNYMIYNLSGHKWSTTHRVLKSHRSKMSVICNLHYLVLREKPHCLKVKGGNMAPRLFLFWQNLLLRLLKRFRFGKITVAIFQKQQLSFRTPSIFFMWIIKIITYNRGVFTDSREFCWNWSKALDNFPFPHPKYKPL